MSAPIDIDAWLAGLGLGEYAAAFREHAIDAQVLGGLTDDDLREIGVTKVGHRRRLRTAITELTQTPVAVTAAAPGPLPAAGRAAARPADEAGVVGEAERRTLTVLICDLVGSTAMAAQLDPEETREVIRRFHETCTEAIVRFGGHVARYVGDAAIAYFGYPQAHENEAERAVRAGIAVVDAVRRLPSSLGWPPEVRVGIATGLVVVGDLVGEGAAQERAAVGDTPNLASRLQMMAEPDQILISAMTRRLAGGLFEFEFKGGFTLRGYAEPVEVWRVLGERVVESRFAATHPRQVATMIGRIQEKALLVERWAMTKSGEGQAVLLAGEPGIGKSRLVSDLLDHVEAEPHFRLAYQCWPHYGDSAFFPAIRQLELSAGFTPDDPLEMRREKLQSLLNAVPATVSQLESFELLLSLRDRGRDGAEVVPEHLHRQVISALTERIVEAARTRPVLFVVEDAHWSDPSTADLVGHVIARIAEVPAMVLVTYRPDFACPWAHLQNVTLLKLSHLTRAQAASMVLSQLEGRQLPEAVFDEIVEKTDGVPLFIEQVVQAILESDRMREIDGRLVPVEGEMHVTVPETLHDTLLSRLDRDEASKQVAQVASVIGREFSVPVLAGVMPVPEPALRASLDVLVAASLIVREHGPQLEAYAFRHGLLHEAVYNTLLRRTREDLHGRVAERIEEVLPEIGENRPEVLARHYTEARRVDRACALWLEAGKRATRRGAYGEARSHLDAGLRLLAPLPDDEARARLELPLQIMLAETLRSARFTAGDDARQACRRARALCDRLGERRRLIRVLRLEFGINFNRPDPEGAIGVAREAFRLAEQHGDPIALILGESFSGCMSFFHGRLEAAQGHLTRALEIGPRLKDTRELANLQYPSTPLTYLAWTEMLLGAVEQSRAHIEEAIEVSTAQSTFTLSLTLANASLVSQTGRDYDRLLHCLERLERLAEARGIPYWLHLVGFHRGFFATREGADAKGLTLMTQAIATFRANAVEIEIPFYLSIFAEQLAAAGRTGEALATLSEALNHIKRTGEWWCLPEIQRLRARLLRPTAPAQAQVIATEAQDLAHEQGAALWELRLAEDRIAAEGDGEPDEDARRRRADVLARRPDLRLLAAP
ncbi:MAG: AAA family ATPase [Rhodospirillaceae bacterium]|nr:AAA family ATPase [Rhodospirillaceae bacterium]